MVEEPWYMTEKGLLAGLFISLLFWFLCVTGCMAVFGDPGFILDTGTPKLRVPFPISPFFGFVLIGLVPFLALIAYRTYSALALFGMGLCMVLGIPAIVFGYLARLHDGY
jgi:hypothetical protein